MKVRGSSTSLEAKVATLSTKMESVLNDLRETRREFRRLERAHAVAADGDMGMYRLFQCIALLLRQHVGGGQKDVPTLEGMYLDELLTEYQACTQEDMDGRSVSGVKRRRLSRAGPECDRSFPAGSSSGAAAAAAAAAAGSEESEVEEDEE